MLLCKKKLLKNADSSDEGGNRQVFPFLLNAFKMVFGKVNQIIIPCEIKPVNEVRQAKYIIFKMDQQNYETLLKKCQRKSYIKKA